MNILLQADFIFFWVYSNWSSDVKAVKCIVSGDNIPGSPFEEIVEQLNIVPFGAAS
jgi:hypothetical protein